MRLAGQSSCGLSCSHPAHACSLRLEPSIGKTARRSESAPRSWLDGEQLLVEAADLPFRVDEMNLQDPVTPSSLSVGLAQIEIVAVTDGESGRVAGGPLVWEATYQVAGRGSAKLPASLRCELADVIV